jgi:uncharacterized membrane protein
MKTKTNFFLFLFALLCFSLNAQTVNMQNETMADAMRSNGKIYVVVAVVSTILIGLILYVLRVEKKISAIEKDIKKN